LRGQITLNLTIWAEKMFGIQDSEDPVFRVFYRIKIEGKNSEPTKSPGLMGIPVLRGSGLEGFFVLPMSSIKVILVK